MIHLLHNPGAITDQPTILHPSTISKQSNISKSSTIYCKMYQLFEDQQTSRTTDCCKSINRFRTAYHYRIINHNQTINNRRANNDIRNSGYQFLTIKHIRLVNHSRTINYTITISHFMMVRQPVLNDTF